MLKIQVDYRYIGICKVVHLRLQDVVIKTIVFVLCLEDYLKFLLVGLVDRSIIVFYVVADPYIKYQNVKINNKNNKINIKQEDYENKINKK